MRHLLIFSFVLLFCDLGTAFGQAPARDLNSLEMGTHDLAEVTTSSGITLTIDPVKIGMVFVLPRTSGSGRGSTVTNIVGLAGGPQEVDESADHLLDRLDLKPYFITLTLADGAPLWIKISAIAFFRAVEPWDHTRPDAKTVIYAGNRPIFVKESPPTIRDAVNAIRRRNRS
ncbi:MAG: hypothetical protein ABJA75_15995 [Bradyrhizobium sp.]